MCVYLRASLCCVYARSLSSCCLLLYFCLLFVVVAVFFFAVVVREQKVYTSFRIFASSFCVFFSLLSRRLNTKKCVYVIGYLVGVFFLGLFTHGRRILHTVND